MVVREWEGKDSPKPEQATSSFGQIRELNALLDVVHS